MSAEAGPGNRAVGITDLIAYRECPRRASYGLKRHRAEGQDPHTQTPEAGSRATAYGSAVHEAIARLEDGRDHAQAIQQAWDEWGRWLAPEDLDLLKDDLTTFDRRDFPNTRAVLVEDEVRVPIRLADGELAYFRGRIDRLYERLDAPGHFIHIDYKSSRWARSETEIQSDLQMWAYNWALHEYLPEIEDLLQIYDQLRYGQLRTRKSDDQRRQIHDWLAVQMSTFFHDENVQEDGLLEPRHNQWCPWCPILESCPIVAELSEFAKARIATLGDRDLDGAADLERYSELYEVAKDGQKVLERFVQSMNDLAKKLPDAERARYGFSLTERKNMTFTTGALEQLRERLGDVRFLELISLPKTRLESLDNDEREWALSLMEPATPTSVIRRRSTT